MTTNVLFDTLWQLGETNCKGELAKRNTRQEPESETNEYENRYKGGAKKNIAKENENRSNSRKDIQGPSRSINDVEEG